MCVGVKIYTSEDTLCPYSANHIVWESIVDKIITEKNVTSERGASKQVIPSVL